MTITDKLHPNDSAAEKRGSARWFVAMYSVNPQELNYMMSVDDDTLVGLLQKWKY